MLRKIAGGAADFYTAGVAVWAVAWKLNRDRWGILGLANAWAFWLLITALPIGLFRLGHRSRWLAAGWLAGGLALLAGRYTFALPQSRQQQPSRAGTGDQVALRFMSFNLLKENADSAAAIALIQRESPDLVVLQELEPDMEAALTRGLGTEYPYHHYAPHPAPGAGLGVYARLPFRVSGVLPADGGRPYALRVTLDLPETSVDVYNVHLLPTAGKVLFEMGLTPNFKLRTQQAQDLVDEIGLRGRPALALGDYNLTEASEGYRVLANGLKDAWRVAGRGMGWTWPRSLAPHRDLTAQPVLRIDYCFCSEGVDPWRMQVLRDVTGSDHCPLIVDARIPVPEGGYAIDSGWPFSRLREPSEHAAYAGRTGVDSM